MAGKEDNNMGEIMREKLLQKSFKELYQLRCDQYCSKEEIVNDILAHDDGSVREMVQTEGSFLWLMVQSSVKKRLDKLLETIPVTPEADSPGRKSASGGKERGNTRHDDMS